MFKLGVCSSGDRVLELTKSLSDNMTNQYHHDGVFCPSKLKKSVATILAKDNCDLISQHPPTASIHYHGTSTTISFLAQLLRQTILVQKRYRYFLHPMLRPQPSIYLKDCYMRQNLQM